jgi:hypothetical protein
MSRLIQRLVFVCLLVVGDMPSRAQLAITEVMSDSSRAYQPGFRGPDYWELTNFGTNSIDLTGYSFSDRFSRMAPTNLFAAIVISNNESIIFCRTNPFLVTREQFDAWWGSSFLSSTRLYFYYDPGLDQTSDALTLYDAQNNVMDHLDLGEATPGYSFVFDPDTGEPGVRSEADKYCAFRAATTDDIGSPGCHSGRITLSISEHPASQTLNGCGTAQLRVRARGMPRPKYQWFRNGTALDGATLATLEIPNVGAAGTDTYHVVLSNGVEVLTSTPAIITLATNPLPPRLEKRPANVTAFPSQTVVFEVRTRALPCPNYQWQCDGTNLPGATAAILEVPIPTDAQPATREYAVRVWNHLGETNARATLTITDWPQLKITEVMSSPMNDPLGLHEDWFEITNEGTDAVDLQDYRLADAPSLDGAFVITDSIVIKPGESIVFVEGMTREAFFNWWGAANLPRCLQVANWVGFSLDGGADEIFVWNAAARSVSERVSSALFGSCGSGTLEVEVEPGFEPECLGPDGGCVSVYWRCSVGGMRGAFVSAEGGDVGSPGNTGILPPPPGGAPPRILSVIRDNSVVWLICEVMAGKQYRLAHKASLADPTWITGAFQPADSEVVILQDTTAGNAPMRFYRVEESCD